MTCAHIVDVALRKVPGVETVDVSLNKGLATVKLKPGNTVSVPQLWELLHQEGYTPKTTTLSVRGELVDGPGRFQLKISGTKDLLDLAADPKSLVAYNELAGRLGQVVTVRGVMVPAKDLKARVPLQVNEVQQ